MGPCTCRSTCTLYPPTFVLFALARPLLSCPAPARASACNTDDSCISKRVTDVHSIPTKSKLPHRHGHGHGHAACTCAQHTLLAFWFGPMRAKQSFQRPDSSTLGSTGQGHKGTHTAHVCKQRGSRKPQSSATIMGGTFTNVSSRFAITIWHNLVIGMISNGCST